MPGPKTAEQLAQEGLAKRSVADDPFELAQELAGQRRGSATPAPPPPPEEESPGLLAGLAELLGFGGEEEAPPAPPPSTALSVAMEKQRMGLPLTPEEQAAMAAVTR